jgi:orotidine-5'-phosphate decarboxylase
MAVAELAVRTDKHGNVGVVMGATAPNEAAAVRAAFPKLPFLLPGIGRQGGNVEAAVRASFTGDYASCLVAIVAAIMYADDPRSHCCGVAGPYTAGYGTTPSGRQIGMSTYAEWISRRFTERTPRVLSVILRN